MENKEKIRNFLAKHISTPFLQDNDNIFAQGLINSMFAVELVLFLEKEFKLNVNNNDLELKNFSSVNNIYNFINTKLTDKNL